LFSRWEETPIHQDYKQEEGCSLFDQIQCLLEERTRRQTVCLSLAVDEINEEPALLLDLPSIPDKLVDLKVRSANHVTDKRISRKLLTLGYRFLL
jgi:hypothetical protein